MASATEATISSILKEVYPGAVEDEFNNECALWAIFEKTKVSVGGQGKRIVRPMRVARNGGIGSRVDNGTLPAAGSQVFTNANINLTTTYLRGQLSGRVMRTSATDTAAFEDALSEEIRFGLSDYVTDLSRQLFMGGGRLALTNGLVTTSTQVVVTDVSNLSQGMVLEFWTAGANQTTNDAGITGSAIASINTATKTLTMTTAQASITTGATVSRQGNNTSATTTNEMAGLDTIIDDGTDYAGATYFGINRTTTYPLLLGNRVDIASGTQIPGDATTTIGENKLQYGVDQARKIGGGYVDLFITDFDTRRKYSNLLLTNKRYPVQGITAPQFAGGFERSQDLRTNMAEGLSFDGAPIIASRQCPAAKLWGLDTSSFKVFQQSDVEWVPNGDSVLHPVMTASNQDGYQYAMLFDANLYCEAPNRSVKFVNTLN